MAGLGKTDFVCICVCIHTYHCVFIADRFCSFDQGAWWGLMAGLAVGVVRMGIHFSYGDPYCHSSDADNRPSIYTDVHYLHFAIILSILSLIVVVCVSMVTKPRPANKVSFLFNNNSKTKK